MSVSRWLNWIPSGGSIIGKTSEPEPPKPTKPTFGGFGGTTPGIFQKKEAAGSAAPDASNPMSPAYVFPHCPRCSSHYLFRENNAGNYECMTCELKDIPEDVARRVQ